MEFQQIDLTHHTVYKHSAYRNKILMNALSLDMLMSFGHRDNAI